MANPAEEPCLHKEWELPPLILHPFNHDADQTKLLESIRLSMYTHGFLELEKQKEWEAVLLEGRYSEFRMLCFIGKDLTRWIRQCADFTGRDDALKHAGIREQSFADLLVHRTPARAADRFEAWGVADFRRIFRRAIGLNAVFPHPPAYAVLSTDFLVNCYAYADALFVTYQSVKSFTRIEPERFHFSVYTSAEYANLIENTPPA
jgi:hypothetical protein